MSAWSLALLGCAMAVSAPPAPAPESIVLNAPRFLRGEEILFTGEVLETSDGIGNRFRKKHALEIRLFVIEVEREYSDCAIIYSTKALEDPIVAQAIASVSGTNTPRDPPPASVHIELIRIDTRGRVKRLEPALAPPPLVLRAETRTADAPLFPVDVPASLELGMFIPLPIGATKIGSTWDSTEPNRPPLAWTIRGTSTWNGGRCLHLTAVQHSEGWDRPDIVRTAWGRAETVLVPPGDGFASVVHRIIQRRDRRDIIGSISVKYEREQTIRHVGDRYNEVKTQVEAAWFFARDLAELQAPGTKTTPKDFRARLTKIEQYLEDSRTKSGFRTAIESTRRRCEAATLGAAPAVAIVRAFTPATSPDKLEREKPAPDFIVADIDRPTGRFRLSNARGKPVVLIFYKPQSQTTKGALELADALTAHFANKVVVLPLACENKGDTATSQRKTWGVKSTLFDGDDVKKTYGIEAYPRFILIDPSGLYRWDIEGIGNETGFLVKEELDRLLAERKR